MPARGVHSRDLFTTGCRDPRQGGYRAWLNGTAAPELLKSAAEDLLRMWEVSRRVNKTDAGDDDPTLVEQVPA